MLAVFTVNSDLDNTIGGDGLLTLREAVNAANQFDDPDTIDFAAGLDGATIALTQGELSITDSVTIDASMLSSITIDAGDGVDDLILGDGFRIFDIEELFLVVIDVTLRGLTLTGGDVAGDGGAIRALYTNLTIDDCIIDGNYAAGDGGGIYAKLANKTYIGGPIPIGSTLVVKDSVISGNTAVLRDSVMSGESAGGDGGGIAVFMPGTGQHSANDSKFKVLSSIVKDNEAFNRGGGIHFESGAGGETLIKDSVITGNKAGSALTLSPAGAFLGPLPHSGGGIYAYLFSNSAENASLTIGGTTISGNEAGRHGGGLVICTKNDFIGVSEVSVYNTTISGNQAGHTTAANYPGTGGGVHLGVPDNTDTSGGVTDARFQNVTITDNTADQGGGIFSFVASVQELINDVRLTNSIVSANRKHDLTPSNLHGSFNIGQTVFNIIGPSGSGNDTYNHITRMPAALSVQNIFDNMPMLGPLANHGGPTPTHRLLQGSPAIDAGLNDLAVFPFTMDDLTEDQRGVPFVRRFDGDGMGGDVVDIGAYEIGLPKVINVIISSATALEPHPPFSFDTVDGSGDQLKTVPVGLADTIAIVFSEDLDPASIFEDRLRVIGLTTANEPTLVADSFQYSQTTDTASWQFEGWTFYGDNYLISLTDQVKDVSANKLDGEWTNPKTSNSDNPGYSGSSEFPSGDGTAGGSFNFIMTLLPGDATLDGFVFTPDLSILLTNFNMMFGQLFVDADFNGDGAVITGDLSILLINWGTNLQDLFVLADLNGDFVVDGSDLQTINDNQGMTSGASYADGDLDGDGDVDSFDLALADIQFGLEFDWVA